MAHTIPQLGYGFGRNPEKGCRGERIIVVNPFVPEPDDFAPGLVDDLSRIFAYLFRGFPDDCKQALDGALAHAVSDELVFAASFEIQGNLLRAFDDVS